jgi:hypothetical protein
LLAGPAAALLEVIQVDAVAFEPLAVVGVLDRVIGIARSAARLGHPRAVALRRVTVDDLDELVAPAIGAEFFRRQEPGPEVFLIGHADLDHRPLHACARLLPEDQSRPFGVAAFQVGATAVGDIGPRVPLVRDVDPGNRDPADTGVVSDLAGGDRLQQHGEPAEILRFLRHDPRAGRLVLEGLEVLQRVDDRLVEAQHIETIAVRACLVADFDDGAVGIAGITGLPLASLPGLEVQGRVDERIEGLGWDFQLLARLHFLEGISHGGHSLRDQMPKPEKSP